MIIIGTAFSEIYCLNALIKEDSRIKNLTINQQYALSYLYLQYSISYFFADCYKNLEDIVAFSQTEYNFISDGIDNEYLLSPLPQTGSQLYVGYRENKDMPYIEIPVSEYSYDIITGVLTLTNNPIINYQVYVSAYIVGQFNETLNGMEKTILSEGINVPFSEQQLNKTSLLNMMVYGGSTKIYSQANHISVVKGVSNNQYFNIVKGMISEYSYKYNPIKLKGLGGGLVQ